MSYIPSNLASEPSTLVALLRQRASAQSSQRAYTFLTDGEDQEVHLTYEELDFQARAIAAMLQRIGAQGRRVLLLYPPGLEYIAAFFGCLYAGSTAIPTCPPRPNRRSERFQALALDSEATIVLTSAALLPELQGQFAHEHSLRGMHWIATNESFNGSMGDRVGEWHEPNITGDTCAFFQYTSGSTAAPKGVVVSHANLLHNQRMIKLAFQHAPESVIVGWLPLYHDMGLIGNVLQPLYAGAHCVLLSPIAFLQKPLRWLKAIARYRATTSGGPNFAYDLCVRRVGPQQRQGLDLSHWKVAFNGAEPVRADTMEGFAVAFESCGFQRNAFYPCYGLSEATLIVSGGDRSTPPVIQTFDSAMLERHQVQEQRPEVPTTYDAGKADFTSANRPSNVRALVGCGQCLGSQQIVIADPVACTRCPPDRIGEIWLSGPCVAHGYWNHPEETQQAFQAYLSDTGQGPFLRTGDIGFIKNGELFVTGRLKEMIIIRGRNHYPHDIERTVEQSHPALQPQGAAAFGVDVDGEERLVILQELVPHFRRWDTEEVLESLREAVTVEHELQVHALWLLKAGSIPKTTSGKTQRRTCRDSFLQGKFEAIAIWRQG